MLCQRQIIVCLNVFHFKTGIRDDIKWSREKFSSVVLDFKAVYCCHYDKKKISLWQETEQFSLNIKEDDQEIVAYIG